MSEEKIKRIERKVKRYDRIRELNSVEMYWEDGKIKFRKKYENN